MTPARQPDHREANESFYMTMSPDMVTTSGYDHGDAKGSFYMTTSSDYDYSDYVTFPAEAESGLLQAIPILYFLMFFMGCLGNLCVLAVLGRGGGRKRLVDTFVMNLAAADLVFVVTLPLWAVSAALDHKWHFGEPLCRISSLVIAVNRFSNVAFLTCMSVDRYLAVVRQLDSRFLRSGRCVRVTCTLVWMLALVLGAPALFFRHVDERGMCVDSDDSAWFQTYSLAMVLLAFVGPVAVILLCYGAICLHLQRHCSLSTNPHMQARRRHTLKIVLAIVTAFVVSWLPYSVCRVTLVVLWLGGGDPGVALQEALVTSSCLAFLNSCANPPIYLLLDRHFRRRAAHLALACLGHRGGGGAHDSLSTADSLSGSTATRSRLHSLNLKT
ncbi:probable G-protein coupled receptor 25 [Clupea harengus]|uniref:Probable G-protein coupled receptor 25 n=1 Tax=Clupea harengus TaxID=7950 RepID=A0A6P3W3V8_CLUHA|nr:probable G-protein coupled receptor 25 [Clupea harengus]